MPSTKDLSELLRLAIGSGCFETEPPCALFYDRSTVKTLLVELGDAFPAGTLHAVAVKACPITKLLRFVSGLGFGAEAATHVELLQALRCGFPPETIVFDSPAKTAKELRFAFGQGVYVNADSLQELSRIDDIIKEFPLAPPLVGVRVNPALRAGRIASTSTTIPGSKFGVSVPDEGDELLDAFARYSWLRGLHLHVGSQGCDLGLLADNAAALLGYIDKIEERVGPGVIKTLDIGGGLPASYRDEDHGPSFSDYTYCLRARTPRLFSGEWRLITEFGRKLWANSCVAISRVEYTKASGGNRIAVVHFGADLFPRTAYHPDNWYHRVSVYDSDGNTKDGATLPQTIAGPLCFSGDLVARNRRLPAIEPGDYVAIHDAGAYTLSMWSRYNSRRSPAVYGFSENLDELELLRRPESEEDVLRFWD